MLAALSWRRCGAVAALLRAGADPRARDADGDSALAYAARDGSAAVAAALLTAGAFLLPDEAARAVLGGAERGHAAYVRALLVADPRPARSAEEWGAARAHPAVLGVLRAGPLAAWLIRARALALAGRGKCAAAAAGTGGRAAHLAWLVSAAPLWVLVHVCALLKKEGACNTAWARCRGWHVR